MEGNKKWPPLDWLWAEHRKNSAWYSGRHDLLKRNTSGFWKSEEKNKAHVPIAADLAAVAAGFLFSGSPTITHDDEKTNARLQELTEKTGLYQCLLQGAELQSVFGGVFLKLNWDKGLAPHPLISVVPGSHGIPTYQNGILTQVQFWSEERRDDNGTVWRLEETYTRNGEILSTLYKGDAENLGSSAPLASIPETRGARPRVISGTETLLATYVPNRLPNRNDPYSHFGSSDFEGLYDLFSALDEAYSSLMRDVRLSKSLVIVPMQYLRKREKMQQFMDGQCGADQWAFCLSDEIFTALDMKPDQAGTEIKHIQPDVRADQLLTVVNDLIRRIYMMGGYSPQSAGIDIDGQAESGTALNVRERRSMQTAETKKTYWWHALVDFMEAMLLLDAKVFGSKIKTDGGISVAFADNTQPDQQTIADTLDKIERAHAASLDTKVRMLHPDWDDETVLAEVAAIKRENGMVDDDPPDASLGDLEGAEANPAGSGEAGEA